METVISFSAKEAIEAIIWICGALITISGATAIVVRAVHKAKSPDNERDKRIEELSLSVAKHAELLAIDKKRLDTLETNNRVVMRALLALLSHGIDGNDIQAMQASKLEITTLLINK